MNHTYVINIMKIHITRYHSNIYYRNNNTIITDSPSNDGIISSLLLFVLI